MIYKSYPYPDSCTQLNVSANKVVLQDIHFLPSPQRYRCQVLVLILCHTSDQDQGSYVSTTSSLPITIFWECYILSSQSLIKYYIQNQFADNNIEGFILNHFY